MSDGWRDSVVQKDIVNFLVNSPKGLVFIRSKEVSEVVKDATMLFKLLDEMVEEVGEKNVIQVVTDNASNYVKAGKLLEAKCPHLFWTPCAAHCIDLMLEDIGKICCEERNEEVFTNQKNLHRPAVTRFATSFITMTQFHLQQANLKKMVTSEEWNKSKWPKEAGARKMKQYILQESFWRNIAYALKLTCPLVKVLRMVDGEKKPAMGYINAAMDRAKETNAKSFKWKKEKYEKVFEMVDKRWDCQLHQPLHAAGYFLNPAVHYTHSADVCCEEVETRLYNCITKLVRDSAVQDMIMVELEVFKSASGLFGLPMAIRQREIKSPGWRNDAKDPILLDEIDDSNEWLMGKMDGISSNDEDDDFVHDDEDLTWSVVSKAVGAEEPSYTTRGAKTPKDNKGKGIVSSSTQNKRLDLVDEDDDDIEGEEGFGYEKDLEYEENGYECD
ncbi:uncharacterized protein LOC106405160 [Brassica napus]|uniref:uncharacterized protein LOC106405160 n=1 Tax=Brassica napus TaxID=3708 RepID=UPI00207A3F6D|nr:uncharacterized protein LOC106405160 [Brassica napus]